MNAGRRQLPTEGESTTGLTAVQIGAALVLAAVVWMVSAVFADPDMCRWTKHDQASNQVDAFRNGLDIYYARKGHYPDVDTGLKALIDAQVMEKVPLDPWQNAYLYLLENGKPVIKTYGKDGQQGGEGDNADISSRELFARR